MDRRMKEEARELSAEEIENGYLPASEVETYNPDRYSFAWNYDYSGFVPHKLAWFDNESYMRYQSEDMDNGECDCAECVE